ncbi:MAG: UDP-N-acetylglucosamine 2-epimerase (non-hydrolyzing) [Methanoregula sp.]|nr:UDP-N-acetylglucosamine 2-epimerase (non-hydrolyzing) [Methanoregula sp.]
MCKVTSIVGARPQFVKLAPMCRALAGHDHKIIHTGQHYDDSLSASFFRDLNIPEPCVNLCVGSGPHGWQTGQMLAGIEACLEQDRPDVVIVYGDTNSTLAGALAASKLNIPVAHVEAGLRSFRSDMPEEINRIVADRVSSILFCPTPSAAAQLEAEGFKRGSIFMLGDVMKDAFLQNTPGMPENLSFNLPDKYAVVTIHRAENADNPARLREILDAMASLQSTIPIIFPVHPRTAKLLPSQIGDIKIVEPLPYLDMLRLVSAAGVVLTDSGGLQKESYLAHVPCVVLRDETEHTELVRDGWSILAGADRSKIIQATEHMLYAPRPPYDESLYGDGHAAEKIVAECMDYVAWLNR